MTVRYAQLANLLNCTIDEVIGSTIFQNINKLAILADVEQTNAKQEPQVHASPIKHVIKGTHYNVTIIDFKAYYPNIVLEHQLVGPNFCRLIQRLLTERANGNTAAKQIVNTIIGCMNNQYSGVYNPDAYAEIVSIGRQTIMNDLDNELKSVKHIFSNTDSIGFTGQDHIEELQALIAELNQKRVFLKYSIENQFKVVRFANVNKYAGLTHEGMLILKGFPKTISNDEMFQKNMTDLLKGKDWNWDEIDTVQALPLLADFFNDEKDYIQKGVLVQEMDTCKRGSTYCFELIANKRTIHYVDKDEKSV